MIDNFGLMKGKSGQGFSKERMDLFKQIIDYISDLSVPGERNVYTDELEFIPGKMDVYGTVIKAIEFYAVPNGICIVEDPLMNCFYRVRTIAEYGIYSREVSDQIIALKRQKDLATAAWLNNKDKD